MEKTRKEEKENLTELKRIYKNRFRKGKKMGFFGKLFGSNEHDAKDTQGHLKTKNYKKLDWAIDDDEHKKQDYIGSTEYIVPSDSTMNEIIRGMNDGKTFPVRDVFFRVDYVGRKDEWHKKREYQFKELILKKKMDSSEEVYILEGTGQYLKEDYTGAMLETLTEKTDIYAEIVYKDKTIEINNCRGFNHTDNWYAFMLLFKLLEDIKYPPAGKKEMKN